jgi:hypothetical protein
MAPRTVIFPEEDGELQQLREGLLEATKRATEALRKIGPTMDGPALQRFREEIAKVRIMQQRIDEIRGFVRDSGGRQDEPNGDQPGVRLRKVETAKSIPIDKLNASNDEWIHYAIRCGNFGLVEAHR